MSKILIEESKIKQVLEALEQIKRLTGARWALENNYAGHLEAITALREALEKQPAQRKQVGDSRFESWYSEDFDPKGKGTKQQMREAYEAGMNDPSPQPAQQEPEPTNDQVQAAFEDWLASTCPSGDTEAVQRQWESSSEYIDLYTSPPAQRKQLTDEKIDELSRTMVKGDKSVNWLCRAIEAAHNIKEQK